jgi:hypothetical protein
MGEEVPKKLRNNTMDTTLHLDQPAPNDLPKKVILDHFIIGPANDRTMVWRLVSGSRTWTPHGGDAILSVLLAWLERNGYSVVAGSDPAEFRRSE